MNTDIAALQTIVDVLQDNDCVTDVVPVVEGTTIIGYTLRFLHHAPITIYHGEKSEKGEKGDKGDEGLTPTIGIRQDTGGVWYWTLNGEWLTDSLGNKIKAESRDGKDGENGQDGKDGEDGQDGVTPRLKIEEEYWYVSYTDGASWERLGKATGETGTTGESFFRDVTQDAENVYLIPSDGTTVTVPKGTSLNISFAESDLTRMPVNSTRELHYTVTGAISEATVEALSSADMKVKVEPDDATGINGKIVLVSGAEINDDSKVVIFVTNGERMLMRTLLFDKVGIPAVEETTKCVDAAGGRIELAFLSDSDCEAEIPDEARSWVRVAPSSRALTPHSIVLDIAANTDRPRSTVMTVRSVFVPTQCIEYTVEQAVGSTQLLYTTTGPCLQLSSDAFDGAIVSHTFKNGVGTIIFDKPITFLPKNTFADNPTLTGIAIPEGVTSIETYAVSGCSSLTSIKLPENLTTIGTDTFAQCYSLTDIIIPGNVTLIKDEAFCGCFALTSVYCRSVIPPVLGNYTFENTPNPTIYVPTASVEAYRAQWSEYASQIVGYEF